MSLAIRNDFVLKKKIGAGNETRTRDPDLGKVVLYQLSYSRFNQNVLIFLTIFWRIAVCLPMRCILLT